MSKLKEHVPDWTADDWANYYRHTWILPPGQSKPVYVMAVETGPALHVKPAGKHEAMLLPTSTLTWEHLKHPKLGWILVNGLPIFAVKLPLRVVSKGFRSQVIDFELPRFLNNILKYFELEGRVRELIENRKPVVEFYDNSDIVPTLEDAVAHLEKTRELAVVVRNRQNLLMLNPNPDTLDEFPYLFAHGPDLAALLRRDLTIKQVSNADLGDILYAD